MTDNMVIQKSVESVLRSKARWYSGESAGVHTAESADDYYQAALVDIVVKQERLGEQEIPPGLAVKVGLDRMRKMKRRSEKFGERHEYLDSATAGPAQQRLDDIQSVRAYWEERTSRTLGIWEGISSGEVVRRIKGSLSDRQQRVLAMVLFGSSDLRQIQGDRKAPTVEQLAKSCQMSMFEIRKSLSLIRKQVRKAFA